MSNVRSLRRSVIVARRISEFSKFFKLLDIRSDAFVFLFHRFDKTNDSKGWVLRCVECLPLRLLTMPLCLFVTMPTFETDRRAKEQCIQLIFRVTQRQRLPSKVASTASILFHKFYENINLDEHDRFTVSIACCFLAAKARPFPFSPSEGSVLRLNFVPRI